MHGGLEYEWLRPYDDDRDGEGDPVIGCHVGNTEALNVRNPQPGFRYYHGPAQRRGVLRSLINRGWEVVPPDAPERIGDAKDPRFGSAVDSSQAFGDTVLMRAPDHLYRKIIDEEAAAARYALGDAGDPFLDGATDAENHYSRAGRPTRYRRPDHRGTWIGDENE